jgi:RNA recognition motif-containing protein
VLTGYAFANFHKPQDAQAAVDQLNNYMLNNRRLCVELKKKLSPEEERARQLKRQVQPSQPRLRMYDIYLIDCIEVDPQIKPQIVSREQTTLAPTKGM